MQILVRPAVCQRTGIRDQGSESSRIPLLVRRLDHRQDPDTYDIGQVGPCVNDTEEIVARIASSSVWL